MKNLINKIIKTNKNKINFTNEEEKVINKYTEFYNNKIKEKLLNSHYLNPESLIFMNDGYVEIDSNGYPFETIETKNFILNEKSKRKLKKQS
jgi:hypothetical protein